MSSFNALLHNDALRCPPHLGGLVVSVSDSWPGSCEFNPLLRRLFFLAYFCLSPLQKHVRKVVGGFGKVVLVLVWESQETHNASLTTMIWPYLLKWRYTPIQPTLDALKEIGCFETFWEKEKMLVTTIFSFSHIVVELPYGIQILYFE